MFKFVGENFALKVISLVAAVVMWMYVSAERYPTTNTRVVNASVAPVGAAPPDAVVRIKTDSLQVEVSGPKSEVDAIADNEIRAEVDVRGARPGMTKLPVTTYRKPSSAPNVNITQQGKRMVTVEVVSRERKQVAITPLVNTAAAAGRRYGAPKLNPEWATVIGSAEDLKRVVRVVVLIETNGVGMSADLPLKAQDRDGVEVTNVDLEPAAVHVDLAQPDLPATRTLPVSVNVKGRPAPPFVVSDVVVEPAQVTVTGRGEQLVQMTNVHTAEVTVDGLNSDLTREATIQLPAGVTLKGGKNTVRVMVRVRDASRTGG